MAIVDDVALEKLYLTYVANQVSPWQTSEIAQLKSIINSMSLQYHLLPDFTLPPVLFLVKTSGKEEGYAAYTRQLNTNSTAIQYGRQPGVKDELRRSTTPEQ